MEGLTAQDLFKELRTTKEKKGAVAAKNLALEILRGFPVIDVEDKGGGVKLERRVIGTFAPQVEKRDKPEVKAIVGLQGLLQDLLTDEKNSPSTTFDPRKGRATITTRQTLLG